MLHVWPLIRFFVLVGLGWIIRIEREKFVLKFVGGILQSLVFLDWGGGGWWYEKFCKNYQKRRKFLYKDYSKKCSVWIAKENWCLRRYSKFFRLNAVPRKKKGSDEIYCKTAPRKFQDPCNTGSPLSIEQEFFRVGTWCLSLKQNEIWSVL